MAIKIPAEVNDKVEDALELGNVARDRNPPDYQSAERAYRLALKLDPSDPRPLVGLANLYFDQGQFPESAKAYKDAIRLAEPLTRALPKGDKRPPKDNPRVILGPNAISRDGPPLVLGSDAPPHSTADLHAYLATALIQELKLAAAERELRLAVSADPRNPNWHALLGYALFIQERYTEAAVVFKESLKLHPDNNVYERLLKQSSEKAKEASAQDKEKKKSLERSKWEIRENEVGLVKGTCELKTKHSLRCESNVSNDRHVNSKWNIRDGLFFLESEGRLLCIGRMSEERIDIKCPVGDLLLKEVWVKQAQR
jgi:tetratricopeptide (TPR) repeat protein